MMLNRDNSDFLNVRRFTPAVKALLVLAFAVMSGFMWRVRGSHGYGSMWGMFAVGVMLTLFIFAFFGNRRKMGFEALPVSIILLGITNMGWGTLVNQMGGYFDSTIPFTGQESVMVTEMSPFSGMAIMLLLGFGWMPLYSTFIGSLFSEKEYKIKHYISLIAVFYAALLVFEFFAAHHILPFVNPQATEMFKQGLADKGVDCSPMMAFIKCLGSESWFKEISFGRNYHASIRAISHAAASLVLTFAVLIGKRDKLAAFISFAMNLVLAVSITAANVVMVIDSDTGFFANINAPAFLAECNTWSLWEYLTGFLMGFGIMLLLVCLPKKVLNGEGYFEYKAPFKSQYTYGAYSAIFTLFLTFVLTLARPIGLRASEWFAQKGLFDDEDLLSYIIIGVICVVGLAASASIAQKNAVKKQLPNLFATRTEDFCLKATPIYFAATAFIYFFTGAENIIAAPILQIKNPSSFFTMIRDGSLLVPILMILSLALFAVLYSVASQKAVKKK